MIEAQVRLKTWCYYILLQEFEEINNKKWQNWLLHKILPKETKITKIPRTKKYKLYKNYIKKKFNINIDNLNIIAAICIGNYIQECVIQEQNVQKQQVQVQTINS